MAGVFISYKREDLGQAQRVVQGLRGAGLSVWWDQDIPPDAAWEATIERELDAAKVVIVIWSRISVASENVRAEARRARGHGKLIQVFVEPCEPPLFFGERQGVDLERWAGDAQDRRFQTVIKATEAVLNGRRPPAGVGYAPARKSILPMMGVAFAGVAGTLALIADLGGARDLLCSPGPLSAVCQRLGMGSVTRAPAPAEVLVAARRQLLSGLEGVWARSERDCSTAMTIVVETDAAGVSRVRIKAKEFDGVSQVISAEGGTVVTRGVTADRGEIWTYRPDGERLSATDPAGVETALTRCDAD